MTTTQAETLRTTQTDTAHRVAALNRNDRPFHVVLAQQFDRGAIEQLCQLADMIRSIGTSGATRRITNTLAPIGGVTSPSSAIITAKTPNQIGSNPSDTASGKMIGTVISIIET